MMDVVIPLPAIKAWPAIGCSFQEARAIVIVFKHQVNLPPPIDGISNGFRQFDQYVPGRVIDDRMHGVEAQSVEVKFTQPIECVVNEELEYWPAVRAVEIQRFPPRRPVTVGKELRGILVQIVPLSSEVVVDHVQKHHQSSGMCALDEMLQVFRTAVLSIRSERQNPVVTPIARARKICHRHQFDSGNSEFDEVVELLFNAGKGPLRSKRPHMQFIENSLLPGAAQPLPVLPVECSGSDNLAGAVHVGRLKARCRVRDTGAAINLKLVKASRPARVLNQFEPPIPD